MTEPGSGEQPPIDYTKEENRQSWWGPPIHPPEAEEDFQANKARLREWFETNGLNYHLANGIDLDSEIGEQMWEELERLGAEVDSLDLMELAIALEEEFEDGPENGNAGVREPRNPLPDLDSGSLVLDLPGPTS